jgi:hypothetical protein
MPVHNGSDVQRRASDAVNDAVSRTVAIGALGGIALIHVLELPDAFAETTYLGILFVCAVVASLLLAATLTRTTDRRVWAAACALPVLILLGYVLSRTSGLPGFSDDVGVWSEPLGLASMVVEGLLICLTAELLATRWSARVGAGSRSFGTRKHDIRGTQSGPTAHLG